MGEEADDDTFGDGRAAAAVTDDFLWLDAIEREEVVLGDDDDTFGEGRGVTAATGVLAFSAAAASTDLLVERLLGVLMSPATAVATFLASLTSTFLARDFLVAAAVPCGGGTDDVEGLVVFRGDETWAVAEAFETPRTAAMDLLFIPLVPGAEAPVATCLLYTSPSPRD